MEIYVILSGFLIMLASLLGVLLTSKKAEGKIKENLPYLISFSAGVFLFTSFFLIFESFEIFNSIWKVTGLVLTGYLAALFASYMFPRFHHHHNDDNCCDEHKHGGKNILLADSIHNIADGLILVPAFLVSPALGFGTAFSIFIHESLQEISEYFVLRKSGFSVKKALLYNFIVSSTILLGIAIGFLISETVILQGILLSLSAGFFLYIISHDFLPKRDHSKDLKSECVKHTSLIIVGVVLIGVINYLVSDGHSHGHEAHEEEHIEHGGHEVHEDDHDLEHKH